MSSCVLPTLASICWTSRHLNRENVHVCKFRRTAPDSAVFVGRFSFSLVLPDLAFCLQYGKCHPLQLAESTVSRAGRCIRYVVEFPEVTDRAWLKNCLRSSFHRSSGDGIRETDVPTQWHFQDTSLTTGNCTDSEDASSLLRLIFKFVIQIWLTVGVDAFGTSYGRSFEYTSYDWLNCPAAGSIVRRAFNQLIAKRQWLKWARSFAHSIPRQSYAYFFAFDCNICLWWFTEWARLHLEDWGI